MKRWELLNRLSNDEVIQRPVAPRDLPTLRRRRSLATLGMTLLEVLIALSIISITLLGFAETQLKALKMERDFSRVLRAS